MDLKKAKKTDDKYIFGTYRRNRISLVRGRGVYVYDDAGRKYLDLLTGIGVAALGHAHPRIAAAVKAQVSKLTHVSNLYYTEPMLVLAERLTKLAGMKKAFFGNSGAEANEAAFKLVRRYHSEVLGDGRYEIICFKNSFHGRTLANVAATGQPVYQKGFAPLPAGFRHAVFNDAASVEKLITKKTAAIMVEPVQGEAGVYPATKEFMKSLDSLRKKHNLQLIFDEVQCGTGRTGKWYAYMHYGVKPDAITVAKPIGGGLPLGIMMAQGPVTEGFAPGSHASTFGANPVVCAAANAFLDVMEEKNIIAGVRETGAYIMDGLAELKNRYPAIKDVRGMGLMLGVEMDADAPAAAEFFLENGIIVNAIRKNIIRILPPFILTAAQADRFLDTLEMFLGKR